MTPSSGTRALARCFPDQAGDQMLTVHATAGGLGPAFGLVVPSAWVGAALLAGFALTAIRDA